MHGMGFVWAIMELSSTTRVASASGYATTTPSTLPSPMILVLLGLLFVVEVQQSAVLNVKCPLPVWIDIIDQHIVCSVDRVWIAIMPTDKAILQSGN
jgi:hypothetical protein